MLAKHSNYDFSFEKLKYNLCPHEQIVIVNLHFYANVNLITGKLCLIFSTTSKCEKNSADLNTSPWKTCKTSIMEWSIREKGVHGRAPANGDQFNAAYSYAT